MADFVVRQRAIIQRLLQDGDGHHMRQCLAAHLAEVRSRQDSGDSRSRARGGDIDAANASMGVTGADEGRMQHARDLQIVQIAALAGDKLGIFDPANLAPK